MTTTTTTTITVQRPDGTIETGTRPGGMDDVLFARMRQATAAAGRGRLLSYTVDEPELDPADAVYLDALRMADRAESLRDNPAAYLTARAAADEAMSAWREQYPGAAADLDSRAADRANERRAEHANAINRALRGED